MNITNCKISSQSSSEESVSLNKAYLKNFDRLVMRDEDQDLKSDNNLYCNSDLQKNLNTYFRKGLVGSKRIGAVKIDDKFGIFDKEICNSYPKELVESSVFQMPLKCIEMSTRSIITATTERKLY